MTKAFSDALHFLSRREHSAYELANKLTKRGWSQLEVNEAVSKCQQLDLQSDARFVEMICYTRIRQGYGPLKIRYELQIKHVDNELINQILRQEEDSWLTYALAIWEKKYKGLNRVSFTELQRRQQFLLARGFPCEVVRKILDNLT